MNKELNNNIFQNCRNDIKYHYSGLFYIDRIIFEKFLNVFKLKPSDEYSVPNT